MSNEGRRGVWRPGAVRYDDAVKLVAAWLLAWWDGETTIAELRQVLAGVKRPIGATDAASRRDRVAKLRRVVLTDDDGRQAVSYLARRGEDVRRVMVGESPDRVVRVRVPITEDGQEDGQSDR